MDEFTKRQYQIIQILNREKQTINSSFLCAELKVSKRTLIKDIAAINQNKNYILSSKRGYRLNPEFWDSIHKMNILQQEEDDSYELLKMLLISKKTLSIHSLTEQLNLSDSAIQKMVRKYNEWLKDYDVQIIRKYRKGLCHRCMADVHNILHTNGHIRCVQNHQKEKRTQTRRACSTGCSVA